MRREAPLNRVVLVEAPAAPWKSYARSAWVDLRRRFIRFEPPLTTLPTRKLVRPRVKLERDPLLSYIQLCEFSPEQAVPLTYPQLLARPLHLMMMADDEFPWSALGIEQHSITIKQLAAISPNDTLRIEVGCGVLHHHERGQALSIDTHVFRAGQLMWESRVVYLKPGVEAAPGGGIRNVESLPAISGLVRGSRWELARDVGRRHASLSGDFNPIHLNPLVAKLFGFPRTVAPGMWTVARAAAALTSGQSIDAAELRVDFKLPLLLPGEATVWTVPGPLDAFEIRNQNGTKPYLRGRLTLPGQPPQ
jgi:acyl dehydratase